jgi:hypothetical protein
MEPIEDDERPEPQLAGVDDDLADPDELELEWEDGA